MSYDKKKGRSQIGNLTSDHKSLEGKDQMRFDWTMLYTVGSIFSRAIKYYRCTFKIDLIWERYECQKIWDNKKSQGKVTFGCSPHVKHIVYYREGGGASSQRL